MGEHQTNDSAIFSIQHSLENTVLHTENIAQLITFIIFLNRQDEKFVNQKCFKPVKAPPPHPCNMKKK